MSPDEFVVRMVRRTLVGCDVASCRSPGIWVITRRGTGAEVGRACSRDLGFVCAARRAEIREVSR